ncbi:MAG: U32 family peptidase [Kofleriaceae bacterium]
MPRRPEILAPAGDRDCLTAALAAGADAIYLGLDDGFNARARAANFASTDLAPIVELAHRAGARVFVTLNTLVFEPELPLVEELVRRVAAAGVDAIIVQDPAVAQIARAVCPDLELHGSTQMTASSPLAAELLRELGLTRVVVPRELSIEEITQYAAGTTLPLEVFIHGALCVSWSGQCLTSEAWGGRSANRGQCAQSCRLPYELIVDGQPRELGDVAYLLSPRDLVGTGAVPELAAAGVASLKIEGRLKAPHYVAATVSHYRRAVDAAAAGAPLAEDGAATAALYVAYSRGASPGFLDGADHQRLIDGRAPRHRGLLLGEVVARRDQGLWVRAPERVAHGDAEPRTPPDPTVVARAGMGVVFDRGAPEQPEQGGPIFAAEPWSDAAGRPGWHLRFGTPGPDLRQVQVGDRVWITSDPEVSRAGERAAEAGRAPLGRVPVRLTARGRLGEPLEVAAEAQSRGQTWRATLRGETPLAPASRRGLDLALLTDKLGALGGTDFALAELDAAGVDAALFVPVSELKELRRRLVAALTAEVARVERRLAAAPVVPALRAEAAARAPEAGAAPASRLVPLCRTDEQLDALLDAGVDEVELDWMELVGLGRAVERARARGCKVVVATLRVQKPGEERVDQHLAKLAPDGVLVRGWGSLAYFAALPAERRPTLHGDFSLNVTNSVTAAWVLSRGLATFTAAHDLDAAQLTALLEAGDPRRVAVTVHHHMPTFHTEHCVYAHLLSEGRDFRTCGRPCEQRRVSLRDRVGQVHPVLVDVGCRNTVFAAQAQSAASLVEDLAARRVARLRVELVRETGAQAVAVWGAYQALLRGELSARALAARGLGHEQFGVTKGTMRTLTVL